MPNVHLRRADGNWTAFAAAHPAEAGWIQVNTERNGFAYSLRAGVERYGSLTERQLAAVRNALQRNINPANPGHAPVPPRIEVDATALKAALETAVQAGLRRVALTYGDIKISLAGPNSRNPGAVYVTFRGAYVGALRDGEFRRGRDYSNALPTEGAREEFLADLRTIAANPYEQAILQGRRTGSCCCCGRTLTDPESVAAGIGPICAGRFGWSGRVPARTAELARGYGASEATIDRLSPASRRILERAGARYGIPRLTPSEYVVPPATADAIAALVRQGTAPRPPVNDREGMEAEDL